MAADNVKALLEPFPSLFGKSLKNRIALAPMTRARSGKTLVPNKLMEEYYVQRASCGLIITEGTHISTWGRGWVEAPGIWTDEQTAAWKVIVDAVHAKGGVIAVQLWHQGRQSHSSFHGGKPPVSASNVALKTTKVHTIDDDHADGEEPHALTIAEIEETIEDYARAAANAMKAGFDGVEIHGANGYLPHQFLDSNTNLRTDKYGGSIENRFRFLGEVTDAVIKACGSPSKVGVRISPNGTFGEMGCVDFRELFEFVATELGKKNIAFLHVMDGLAFGYHKLGEPYTLADARRVLPKSVVLIGNCGYTPETASKAIESGNADLIAFGRPYLANPDLPERIANGWPLAEVPPPNTWYSPSSENYIFPTYEESIKKAPVVA